MKNKLSNLNDHLFAQLERLGDEEITGEKLAEEITRANAVTDVAVQIIANANLVLRAQMALDNAMGKMKLPVLLTE
jgi:predicted transcriptional regulator